MRIEITRQACCAADDQLGPLYMVVEIAPTELLQDLVSRIRGSGFLQFSSSHTSIIGSVENLAVVRVYSNKDPEYFVDPRSAISNLIKDGKIDFRF